MFRVISPAAAVQPVLLVVLPRLVQQVLMVVKEQQVLMMEIKLYQQQLQKKIQNQCPQQVFLRWILNTNISIRIRIGIGISIIMSMSD